MIGSSTSCRRWVDAVDKIGHCRFASFILALDDDVLSHIGFSRLRGRSDPIDLLLQQLTFRRRKRAWHQVVAADLVCQRFEVLQDGGEVELVARTEKSAQVFHHLSGDAPSTAHSEQGPLR